MAQPSPFENGRASVTSPEGKDALGQLHKEMTESRMSAYVDPGTRWIMTMKERDEFVGWQPWLAVLSMTFFPPESR